MQKALVFDCDGVLLDSNEMKSNAFRQIFKDYESDMVDEFIKYQKQQFGKSRHQLIADFYKEFVSVTVGDEKLQKRVGEFGEICKEQYPQVSLTKGCKSTLERLSKDYALFVVSGSLQGELRVVFEQRNLSSHFEGIFGSPQSKINHVAHILSQYSIKAFIGDACMDYEAALQHKIPFVFMSGYAVDKDRVRATLKNEDSIKTFEIKYLPELLHHMDEL